MLLSVGAWLAVTAAFAQAPRTIEYDIPPQSLSGALNAYALQSDKEILFSPDAVNARRSPGLQGRYTPDRALEILLTDSGLEVRSSGNDTILVEVANARGQDAATPAPVPARDPGREPPALADAMEDRQEGEIEEVVVVGTQIRGASVADILPVTVMDADDVAATAATSGDELFRAIPQAGDVGYNEQTTTVGGVNAARGDVASINLRSIGTGNTLVLLNGRRMVLHPGVQVENLVPVTTVNTNSIPVMGVKRVEMLRDGAAAVYGSDAIAGVINVILEDRPDGITGDVRYGGSEGTALRQIDGAVQAGKTFNGDRTDVSLFVNYTDREAMPASDRDYSRSSDLRRLVAGTAFEGDTNFDNRTSNTPWGYFDPLDFSSTITRFGQPISDDDGDIHIAPAGDGDCAVDAGAVCIAPGRTPRALRYNENSVRDITGAVERMNLFGFLNHRFGAGVDFFAEAGYYHADYQTRREQGAALSSAPVTVPAENYYNPFGPVTFADGRINPNRLSGLNIPDEGLDLDLDLYRAVDAGPRRISVDNISYRVLGGLRGTAGSWDWEGAVMYSEAETDDTTHNRVSYTLLQQALALDTPEAYNPFNGGNPGNPGTGDTTPSHPETIGSILIDVSRVSETSLRLADVRLSRPDVVDLAAGDVGVAIGIEQRRETYRDDRDPRLDGTITFTNPYTGAGSESDVLGSSATPDSAGARDVWSAYAELAVPLASEDMGVPLLKSADLRVAGRYENYDEFGSVARPKFALSWRPVDALQLRGSWSRGFRAPSLPQLFQAGGERVNTREDYIFCEADLRAGRIAGFNDCDRSRSVVSERDGSEDLEPEDTESWTVGLVFTPDFIAPEFGSFAFTVDYWSLDQDEVVGIFGDDNHIALDYLRRVQGHRNPDVIRAEPTAEDIAAFEGTGLVPAGEIIRVDDSYDNLLPRTVEGLDFVMTWALDDSARGHFDLTVNVAQLLTFDQAPSPEARELLAAQADGTISDVVPVVGINSLLRMNGLPEWRGAANLSWRRGAWGAGVFSNYVGSVLDTSATLADGTLFEVDDWFTTHVYAQYEFRDIAGTRVRLGVRNVTDEDPPLADTDYGYIGALHSNRGRYFYASLRAVF